MGKQPYIPLYVGDYLKDTRMLPLAVRGAWVDILLFMWDAPVRGEIIGTLQEISRMIGCDSSEAKFALDLLKQKNTATINLLPSGEYQIISRRMKKDAEISAIRSEVGKKGVEAKKKGKFAIPKAQPKGKQNTDIDNEDDIDTGNNNVKESFDEKFLSAFDEITCENYKRTFRGIDLGAELQKFKTKCDNDQKTYGERDVGGLRTAFQYQLNNIKQNGNGKHKSGNLKDSFDRIDEIIDQQNNP